MTHQRKDYVSWLKDAHAMELALVSVLEKQASDAKDVPHIRERIEEHVEETKAHAEKIETCITRNGGDVSGAKDALAKMAAAIGGLTTSMASDKAVKNIHSAYAAEHFEIATYLVIRAAAEELEDAETATVCDEIMEDEYRMANWAEDQIPGVVKMHLSQEKQPVH